MSMQSDSSEVRKALILIVCLGLGIRLLLFPFSTINSADAVTRTWIAWKWLSNPYIITYGVWGPLHFYLIALSMVFVRDPVIPPVLLHIVFSVATPILLYFFTRNEFGNNRASILVAFTFLFYPLAISNSLVVTAETPFVFFLVLCLLFLSKARRDQDSWKHAMGAGISLTLAGMLRYEGWMLIPLLATSLYRGPKSMIVFVGFSMIHPVLWMIGNGIHFGDPLYSINWASNWEINIKGSNENLTLGEVIRRFIFYPSMTFLGMTPLVSIFCLAGAIISIIRRQRYAVWLIPFIGLMSLFIISSVRGSLGLQVRYTITLGTLLFPFSAEFYRYLGVPKWTVRNRLVIGLLIVSSMIVSSHPQIFHLPYLSWISLIPRFDQQREVKVISLKVNEQLGTSNEGFICDFFGWENSYYVALMTRLHPSNIFMAPGGRYGKLDIDRLSNFINNHQNGVLLLMKGSSLERSIRFRESGQAMVVNTMLSLKAVQSVVLRDSVIEIYRYNVEKDMQK